MVRRRRFIAAYLLGSLLLLAASLHPPTAYSAPGDPPSGSPAGAVYQLPLEQGRSDAAPKGNGGTGAEAGSNTGGSAAGTGNTGSGSEDAGESGSLYRSENNFGSSSQVPGVAAGGSPGSAAGAGGAGGQSASGPGAGSAAIAGSAIAAETAGTGNTSIPASIVLLGAIALLAIVVGILSRRYV